MAPTEFVQFFIYYTGVSEVDVEMAPGGLQSSNRYQKIIKNLSHVVFKLQ